MEAWAAELERGRPEAAWDLFVSRYRRLIFAAIRHYAQDYDDVMDVFARVCEALREDDLRRLRAYTERTQGSARFSTWLVTVVTHLTIDWFRHRDGRRRLSAVAEGLPPLRRRIFELVFLDQRSHIEAYEVIRSGEMPDLSFRQFLAELRTTYAAVTARRRGHAVLGLGAAPPPEAEGGAETAGEVVERREVVEQALASLGRPQGDGGTVAMSTAFRRFGIAARLTAACAALSPSRTTRRSRPARRRRGTTATPSSERSGGARGRSATGARCTRRASHRVKWVG